MRGTLFLIVGPSGAGKDTLIEGARSALRSDPRYVFARRVITRPASAGGEAHQSATAEDFARRVRAGEFMLHWEAHGLGYGLPRSLDDDLVQGRNVVANVSRSVIAEATSRYSPVRVVAITASPEARARRLAARGREDAAGVDGRLAREARVPPDVAVDTIDNDGPPGEGTARLVALLTEAPCSA
jgi:phosphonate metabolism protein PhnN/1,5-bisphosphokinase (PRPP-forming)